MEIPFIYGKIVSDRDFTDRTQESSKLLANFLSQTNTAIISPRRWGKSSLVNKVIKLASEANSKLLFVRMNAFKCETPQEFYELFAKRTVKDLSLGVDWRDASVGEDVLNLPQLIAKKRKKKVIVCIDEFQQIGEFDQSSRFQKILRNHWQEQTDVAYILYGSKKHMMLNIFGEYGKPFYRFCDMMFLPKIDNQDWQEYITRRFSETGKAISPELSGKLADIVDNHPYYVQQLAQYTWLRTPRKCTEDIVQSAFQSMLDSLNLQFVNLMDSLTEKQRGFLCAICDGVRNFSSVETLSRYRLGTSGNIRIMKNALIKRDLIEVSGSIVDIQDPVFKQWILKEYYSI
ncbi:MAG: ATP-binding protein [Bacteroidales bacterium]|nr:ATP-binding protein [Bacteroidales bacterium]